MAEVSIPLELIRGFFKSIISSKKLKHKHKQEKAFCCDINSVFSFQKYKTKKDKE
jgi:hypothetical protein